MKLDFKQIDELKNKLDYYRPLPSEVVKNLHEDMLLKMTYNSNAIEGNTLSLKETKVVLEGITVGGKSLTEHLEAVNHKDAILFIEELAQEDHFLNETDIKSIHALILRHIDDKYAGVYRNNNVVITGAKHLPPHFLQITHKMHDFIHWYNQNYNVLHPIELAARVHVDFIGIHPFIDGNGRTSRLLMNLELIKAGFPPIIIKVENRLKYYETLDIAHTTHNYKPFIQLVLQEAIQSLAPYFYSLGIEDLNLE